MVETEYLEFDDRMNAGAAKFQLTPSTVWHLLHPGERLRVSESIVIQRVVLLVDVSRWQGEIDFVKMKESGVDGVIIKCGQGRIQDPNFKTNMRRAKEAGLARGTYWFFDSRVDPREQAGLWWEWIQDDPGELMQFSDYEENYRGAYAGWNGLYVFLFTFQQESNLPSAKIGIYTGYYYWIAHSPTNADSLAWFARFALWLAWYTDNPAIVIIPKPWTMAIFVLWQYGTPANGLMRGVQSLEIDENNFNGDKQTYAQRFALNLPPPSPLPPGETQMDHILIKSNSTSTRSIRNGPGVQFSKLTTNGDLLPGKIAKAGVTPEDIYIFPADVRDSTGTQPDGYLARKNDTWLRIYENNGVAVIGWIARIHKGQVMISEEFIDEPDSPPPPAQTLPDLPYTIVLGDDVTYAKQTITGTLKPK